MDGDDDYIDPDNLSNDDVLDKIEVNTILYLGRYHNKNPDTFQANMMSYESVQPGAASPISV